MFFSGINHNCFDSPQVGNSLLQVGTHKNEENYGSCSLLCVCVWGGGEGVWWDGKGGCRDITESYGGDQVNLS